MTLHDSNREWGASPQQRDRKPTYGGARREPEEETDDREPDQSDMPEQEGWPAARATIGD